MHPLDPLSADEVRAAAEIIRRERATTDSWRFASLDLAEPAKADMLAWQPGDPLPRRAFAVCWDRSTNQPYEAVADLTADRVESWTAVPGMTPNVTIDEYHEVDVALHEHPEVLAAVARRGIADPSLVLFDVWTYGASVMPEQWRRPTPRLVRRLAAGHPDRQPVRPPGRRAQDHRRPEQPRGAADRGPPRPRAAGGVGGVRPGRARPGPGPAAQAADDPPARGTLLHPGRPPADLAELVAADRLQRPRGPGAAPGPVRRPRRGARHRVPAVLRRDGGALPRPRLRPLPADGVRHRRVGARGDDHARSSWTATAWARSSTSTRWSPTAGASRCSSRRRSACTRRTPACCGSTSTRSPARRAGGCAGWSSRSTPPSRTTSTSSTGASTPTATSSARSGPPGSWSPRRCAADGDRSPYGAKVDVRTYAPYHQHFIVARLDLDVDGPGQHRGPAGRRRAADQSRTTRTGWP